MSCSVSPGVCWIARIGQVRSPKSARLPVTKQIFRKPSVISDLYAGAAGQIDQPPLDRLGNGEIAARAAGEHWKPMHQRPCRAGTESVGVERGQQLIARARVHLIEK